LGNVLATISDRKLAVSANGITVDWYTADVVTANDYYPGGMMMPGRKYQAGSASYRYGFNGQEKDVELGDNISTAQYWEYDSRVGRRWNLDPVPNARESGYLCFSGNPVFFTDVNGDVPGGPGDGVDIGVPTPYRGAGYYKHYFEKSYTTDGGNAAAKFQINDGGTNYVVHRVTTGETFTDALGVVQYVHYYFISSQTVKNTSGNVQSLDGSSTFSIAGTGFHYWYNSKNDGVTMGERVDNAGVRAISMVTGGMVVAPAVLMALPAVASGAAAAGSSIASAGANLMARTTMAYYQYGAGATAFMTNWVVPMFDQSGGGGGLGALEGYFTSGALNKTGNFVLGYLGFSGKSGNKRVLELGGELVENGKTLTINAAAYIQGLSNREAAGELGREGVNAIKKIFMDFARGNGYEKLIVNYERSQGSSSANPGSSMSFTIDLLTQ
jgi:hypothetical protein